MTNDTTHLPQADPLVDPGASNTASSSEPERRFRVENAATANWVLRKVIEARQYQERVRNWAQQEQRKAERRERRLMMRFGVELEAWLRHELNERGGRTKSVNLPTGRVGLRRPTPRLVVADEAALKHWAGQHASHLLHTVVSVSLPGVRQHFKDTGELPDGTELRTPPESLYLS